MGVTVIGRGGDISPAARIIERGGLVAVPTETVYGLCCDGRNAEAVRRLFEVKGRPPDKPVSLLVPDIDAARAVCSDVPSAALRLAEAFWPGPLTMTLPRAACVPDVVTAGGAAVGVRCPRHDVALRLLRMTATPLAAPSANPSGMDSPRDAAAVLDYFGDKIDCVLDGGRCAVGVGSTVVAVESGGVRLLRAGAIAFRDVAAAAGVAAHVQ
ncbi:MAG: threonylcarbamoyl-AMP synthase [Oscillospiraceae bacterium]|jgi:L-threonylcarbamoyladenylate synthase|nr:threonylcarbamoyl-AMP synthase [Oscillospiraceae bacterium]